MAPFGNSTRPTEPTKPVSVLGYSCGKGGRIPGADKGPELALPLVKETLGKYQIPFTSKEVVDDAQRATNAQTDEKIKTPTGQLIGAYSANQINEAKKNSITLTNPAGIKNHDDIVAAVTSLAANVAKDILAGNTPFTVGGDHTQGLGTIKGSMLACTAQAIMSGEIPLHGTENEQASIRETLHTHIQTLQHANAADTIACAQNLSNHIGSLLDKHDCQSKRNEVRLGLEPPPRNSFLAFFPYFKATPKPQIKHEDIRSFMDRFHVIWFDAHADFNSHKTSDTKNAHGMPGAAACGIGMNSFTDILGTWWAELNPSHYHVIGARDTDQQERELMKKAEVDLWRMQRVEQVLTPNGEKSPPDDQLKNVFRTIKEEADKNAGNKAIFIGSFDIDGMNMFVDAETRQKVRRENNEGVSRGTYGGWSLLTGTPVDKGGSNQESVINGLESFHSMFQPVAMDLTELNPHPQISKESDPTGKTLNVVKNMVSAIFCPPEQALHREATHSMRLTQNRASTISSCAIS